MIEKIMSEYAPDFTPTYNAIPGRKVSSTVKGLCGLGRIGLSLLEWDSR